MGREPSLVLSPPPPRFPGAQFNSLPTDRLALSERLERAKDEVSHCAVTQTI